MRDKEPMVPIDPRKILTLDELDEIHEQEDRYQVMLDAEYDGIPVTTHRKSSTFDSPHITPPKRRA